MDGLVVGLLDDRGSWSVNTSNYRRKLDKVELFEERGPMVCKCGWNFRSKSVKPGASLELW
jgi:hypothetical protein